MRLLCLRTEACTRLEYAPRCPGCASNVAGLAHRWGAMNAATRSRNAVPICARGWSRGALEQRPVQMGHAHRVRGKKILDALRARPEPERSNGDAREHNSVQKLFKRQRQEVLYPRSARRPPQLHACARHARDRCPLHLHRERVEPSLGRLSNGSPRFLQCVVCRASCQASLQSMSQCLRHSPERPGRGREGIDRMARF